MVEEAPLKERIKPLEEYIADLRDQKNVSLQELKKNQILRRYLERTLQIAIESCLDVGSHLISELELREPKDNKEIIPILCEAGYLPEEKLVSFKRLAQFRNVLVHDYSMTDPELLYNTLPRSMADLQFFLNAVRKAFLSPVNPAKAEKPL